MSSVDQPADPAAEFDPFAGPALALAVPSTESQREIWTAAQMGDDASCCFNESVSLRLRGPLDGAALTGALQDVVRRHEGLRSVFSADGTTLCVLAELAVPAPLTDLAGRPEAARAAGLAEVQREEVERPFDLAAGPLFRARLVRLAGDDHVLVLTAHHIVCDGWSTGVIVKDLAALYSARRAGRPAGLPAAFPFSAYAQEQAAAAATPEHAAAEAYWLARYAVHPPALDLPVDRRRPPLKSFPSTRLDTALPPALVQGLRKAASRTGGSLFNVLLAGFEGLLHRLTGQEDVVVGVPAAGQAASGHMNLVGHCVNTLAIRTQVAGEGSFASLVGAVRTGVLDAFEHQQLTFGTLVTKLALPRDPSRLPLVSVMFNVDQRLDALPFEGLAVEFGANPRRFENFDVFLNCVDLGGDAFRLEWQFNTDLFDEATIARWARCYEALLRGAAEDPATTVARLPVLTAADRAQFDAWNAEAALAVEPGLQAHALVERQVARTPDAVALTFGDEQLTYRDLDARANRLARRLRALGVGPRVLVGLHLERTPEMLVALLAVAKAGGAYVPLDPAYPADRLDFMVEDSGMRVLVTQASLRGKLQAPKATLLLVDEERAAVEAESAAPLPGAPGASPEDPCYVIYTSGSTGRPKGVAVPHRAVVNLLFSTRERPGMGAGDVIVALTTLSFDIAVFELWLPLSVGARIVLAGAGAGGDGPLLLDLVRKSGVTIVQATPATWRLLIAAGWSAAERVKVISTGEALPVDLAEQLVARSDDVWNMYGPTETTVWSTWYQVPNPVGAMLIGRPVANTQLHILDRHLQPVPVGVAGELFIGGDGVALGYLNRPELDAERFLADPARPGHLLYRTGDVARWRPDGEVECLGRNDHQVKVRGFRIELGEIEVQLGRHPAVKQAVVMAREDRPGDVRLVAYAVPRPGAEIDPEALRASLREALPEYMIPQHVVPMEILPLTPNGKIDRKALPAPDAGAAHAVEYVAPRTETEKLVAALWEQALGIARIGVHDDFFALGGHSLLAAQVSARLSREHGAAVPMRKFFEAPTVAQFALLVGGGERTKRIPRLGDDGPAPVSFWQERTWNLDQLHGGGAVFNLPSAFRLRGALDLGALERSLDAFFARHEATRTTLAQREDGVVQVVAPSLHLPLDPIDLSDRPAAVREQELMADLLAESAKHFDLVRGPLVRVKLYRLAPDEHVVFFMPHHAIWDGWSFDLLVRDWTELYAAEREGRPASLPALGLRYRDFAAWHREWLRTSEEVERQAAWWRDQLRGPIAPLELPTDRPRTRERDDGGHTLWIEIPRAEADALAALAQKHGATLFMAMLAAFEAALHRFTGQTDLLVGTPVRGRPSPELEDLVGTFINTLVLRTRLDGAPSFAELLGRVRTTVRDAFAHEDVPFELLAMNDKPAYRALFSFQDARGRPRTFGDLAMSQLHVLPPVAANDVTLWVMERDTGLVGGLNFSTALFDAATMQDFVACLRAVLRAALAEPGTPIGRLAVAAEAERAGLAGEGAPPATLLDAVAAAPAAAVAVRAPGAGLTYGQLRERAAALAGRLRAAGAGPGAPVALRAEPSAEAAVGALALALLGAPCLPLDPAEPDARAAALLRAAGVRLVLAAPGAEALPAGVEAAVVPLAGAPAAVPPAPAAPASPDAPALLLAVSAPEPALIPVSGRALAAAVAGVRAAAGVAAGDVVLGASALGSGRGLLELWLALAAGAALAPCPEGADDPELLRDELGRAGATVLHAPAWTWRQLLELGWQGGPGFKAICGEPAPDEVGPALSTKAGVALAVHGDAETGLWCGAARLAPGARAGDLGRPLPGFGWRVVDAQGEPAPRGVPGELLVKLPGVAAARPSGLRARVRADGAYQAEGRLDGRLALRGHRIDPREVERALEADPAVREAAVVVADDPAGEPRLLAHVVRRPGAEATDSELRGALRERLPPALVPSRFLEAEALPRRGGHLDRAALPPAFEDEARAFLEPRTVPERLLAELWAAALAVPRVGVHDNFFDLGGHSLLCLQMVAQIEKRTGARLSPRVLLLNTLEQVAAQLPPA